MKKFLFFILISMMCSVVIAQNSYMNEEQAEILFKVIKEFKHDRIALEHFLLVGKMQCYKRLDLGSKKRLITI